MNDESKHACEEAGLPPPRGTIFVMTLYMVVLAAMWGAMYIGLLVR